MTSKDVCVYRASSVGHADIVVQWLSTRGIEAFVHNRLTADMLQTPLIVAPRGVEVRVEKIEEAASARELIEQHLDQLQGTHASEGGPPVETVCEECGWKGSFPSELAGTVENCPECRCYLDVPGESFDEAEDEL